MTDTHLNLRNMMMVRYVYYICALPGRLSPTFLSMSRGNDRDKAKREKKKRKACVYIYLQVKCHERIYIYIYACVLNRQR